MSNLIGQKIRQYQIQSLIGEGGMASVYRAYDLNVKRDVALKIIHPHMARQPQFQQRFLKEAQVTSRLYHPSIIGLYQFGADRGHLFMAMEYLPAGTLGAYLQRLQEKNQSNKLRESMLLAAQIADALAYAHRYGVVHGDVKPDNVLLKTLQQPDRRGEPPLRAVLTDFGLATLLESSEDTATHSFMGSLPYMSPEQCMAKKLDGRSDIYSLGILLYRLVTGQLPFDIKLPTDALMKHLNETPTPPSQFRPDLPTEAEAAILKALAKRPEDRFQSATELAAVLRQIAAGLLPSEAIPAEPRGEGIYTQLEAFTWVGVPSQMTLEQTWDDDFDRLMIGRRGEPPAIRPMDKDLLTVGRDKTNEVVLDAASVSRRHARLEQTTTGWQVVDLGSTNKTMLEGSRLLPDVRETWESDKTLQIGPFYLQWKASKKRASDVAFGITEPDSTVQTADPQPEIHRTAELSALVTPTELSVVAGEQAEQEIALFNQGATVDHYRVEVEGLPPTWVTVSPEPKQLMPGERGALLVFIHPPRQTDSTAGLHPYKLNIYGAKAETVALTVESGVEVVPFGGFTADMQPKSIEGKGTCRILITNAGNFETAYTVVGRDPGEAVRFKSLHKEEEAAEASHQENGRKKAPGLGIVYSRVKIAPGQQGTAELHVAPRRRPLTGRPQLLPFEVQVGTAGAEPQTFAGQLEVKPLLPPWFLPLLGALLLLLCLGAAALWALQNRGNGQTATPTIPGVTDANGSPVASSGGEQPSANGTPEAAGTEAGETEPSVAETAVLTGTAAAAVGNNISVINNNNVIVVVGPCGLTDGQIQAIIANQTATPTPTPTIAGTGTPAVTATPATNTIVITTCSYTIPVATAVPSPTPTVNAPPVANADVFNIAEDTSLSGSSVLLNDNDPEGRPLTAILDSNPANGSLSLNANGTFLYTPRANFSGTDVFTYHASDGGKNSSSVTVLLNINATNDAPVATDDRFSTAEDTPLNDPAFNVLGNDSDVDGPPLAAVLVSNPENGTLNLNGNGIFSYTPDPDFFGSDTFTYRATDGLSNSNTVTVIITVGAVNDAPVAANDNYATAEDTPINLRLLDNDRDIDNGVLTAVLASNPVNGGLTPNPDGSFLYTPGANFAGTDSFTYRASDGTAESNPVTVLITITPVNDPPNAADDNFTFDEDGRSMTGNVLGNDSDADGPTLTINMLTPTSNGQLTLDADGIFVYVSPANFNGTDSFTYQLSDGAGGTDTAVVTLLINPVNDPPVAISDTYNIISFPTITVTVPGVLANDSDIEGSTLTAELVQEPLSGTLALNSDGSFVYTLDSDNVFTDSFTYRAFDGSDFSQPVTVTLSRLIVPEPVGSLLAPLPALANTRFGVTALVVLQQKTTEVVTTNQSNPQNNGINRRKSASLPVFC